MPIIFVLNLKTIKTRRRLQLIGIFSLGIVAIIASAARLRVIILWLSSWIQQAETFANLLIWSQVEQNIGIMAGSIPFVRPVFGNVLLTCTAKSRSSRVHSSPCPGPGMGMGMMHFPHACAAAAATTLLPNQDLLPRELILPSPSPDEGEFKVPKDELVPIQSFKSSNSWGSAIWDGSQVRQVLPT
jgi:hypothetical protein